MQLQYAEVCKAKDALTNQHEASITAAVATALEKAQSDWTIEKQEAVGVAKSEWRRQLTNESTASVKQALEEQSQSWNERCVCVCVCLCVFTKIGVIFCVSFTPRWEVL